VSCISRHATRALVLRHYPSVHNEFFAHGGVKGTPTLHSRNFNQDYGIVKLLVAFGGAS
jgi:hypothetical protein